MSLTAEQLLSVARNYWPADRAHYLHPETSPEVARFHDLWNQELKKIERWGAFVLSLGEALPEFTLGNITAPVDACFRCAVYPNTHEEQPSLRWVVVGCVSILAPVYAVYGVRYRYDGGRRIGHEVFWDPLPQEMRHPAEVIGQGIEAAFGVRALPPEMARVRVPLFVDPQQPPETTLFNALFTGQPESVP
jgi:hypothetical protein